MSQASEDALKLFVGQVPRNFTVDDLRPIMAEAGTLCDITIVRDRVTKESKGCAFVLYSTRAEAESAIAMFHCQRTLPGAKGAMQVKYADGQEHKIENKLFVGMLPKTTSPEDLRELFTPYGTIVDLNVLKGPQHTTRASAFIKFETHVQAQAAIDGLNGKHRMEENGPPMVVKWADTEKERSARKAQKASSASMYSSPIVPSPPGNYLLPSASPSLYASPMPNHLQAYGGMDFSGLYGQGPPGAAQHMASGGHQDGFPGQGPSPFGQAPLGPMFAPDMNPQPMPGGYHMQAAPSASAVAVAVRQALAQKEGPPGANIFIYNIPPEWRDHDLTTAFAEFGNVLSARVFIDKNTGISKNFGFVSYDSAEAAQAAIAVMDGFMVGGRHLKVSIKKGQQGAAPGSLGAPY